MSTKKKKVPGTPKITDFVTIEKVQLKDRSFVQSKCDVEEINKHSGVVNLKVRTSSYVKTSLNANKPMTKQELQQNFGNINKTPVQLRHHVNVLNRAMKYRTENFK